MEKNICIRNSICIDYRWACVCVYLHQTRHLSLLKRCSNGGSEWLTVLDWSAFQKVFPCLIDVHLNHLPFELSPLRYQHLQDRSDTPQMMSLQILKSLKRTTTNQYSLKMWDIMYWSCDCGYTPTLKKTPSQSHHIAKTSQHI